MPSGRSRRGARIARPRPRRAPPRHRPPRVARPARSRRVSTPRENRHRSTRLQPPRGKHRAFSRRKIRPFHHLRPLSTAIECNAPVARFGRVRSSTGIARKRVFIETTAIVCGGFRWTILVSLVNRSDMLCPILLGRRALAGYFLIDPQGTHLLGTRRQLERESGKPPAS